MFQVIGGTGTGVRTDRNSLFVSQLIIFLIVPQQQHSRQRAKALKQQSTPTTGRSAFSGT
jgi:hypothetical protein